MERDTLSFRQLMALLWCALLGPAAQILPGPAARLGGAGSLLVFGAGALMALSGLLLWKLAQGEQGPAAGLQRAFGPFWGKPVLLIYIVWGQVLFTLRLRLAAQRLLGAGERDGAVWFFLGVLALMALWMAHGHLGALGRAAQLMFLATATAGLAVLALASFQVRGENLLPGESWSWRAAFGGALPGVEVMGFGLFAAFLLQPGEERKLGGHWARWTALGCLALAVGQSVALGNFGPVLTRALPSPFFQLAKSVGVEGAFQRLESLVSAVWTFSDLLLLAGILWSMRRLAAVLCPKAPPGAVVTVAALLALVTGTAVFGTGLSAEAIQAAVVPVGTAVLGLVVPALAVLVGRRQK